MDLIQIMAITIPGSLLQNGLANRLPAHFFELFPGHSSIAYAAIPVIPSLAQPLKDEVRKAFADSLRVNWEVLTAIAGVAFLVSLFMKGLPLHTQVDSNWGIQEAEGASVTDVESGEFHPFAASCARIAD